MQLITQEFFVEKVTELLSKDVKTVDAILTVCKKYNIDEENIQSLLTSDLKHDLKKDLMYHNFIQKEATIDCL